jgi:hypothetical protein
VLSGSSFLTNHMDELVACTTGRPDQLRKIFSLAAELVYNEQWHYAAKEKVNFS